MHFTVNFGTLTLVQSGVAGGGIARGWVAGKHPLRTGRAKKLARLQKGLREPPKMPVLKNLKFGGKRKRHDESNHAQKS